MKEWSNHDVYVISGGAKF
jgi:hypothetical protein